MDIDRCGASYELVAALGFSGLGEVRVVVPKNTRPSHRKLLMNVEPSTNVGGRPYNMLDVSKRGYCQPREVLGAP